LNPQFSLHENQLVNIDYRKKLELRDKLYEELTKVFDIGLSENHISLPLSFGFSQNQTVKMLKKDLYREVLHKQLILKEKGFTLLKTNKLELYGLKEVKRITAETKPDDIFKFLRNGPHIKILISGWQECRKLSANEMIEIIKELNINIEDSVWLRWNFQAANNIKSEASRYIWEEIDEMYKTEKVIQDKQKLEYDIEVQIKEIINNFVNVQIIQGNIRVFEPRKP
jgi:hypothetical protein